MKDVLDFLKDLGTVVLCVILYVLLIAVAFIACLACVPVVIVGYPIILIIEACKRKGEDKINE